MTHAIIKPAGGFGYLLSSALRPEAGATSHDTIEEAIACAVEAGYRTFTIADKAADRVVADDEARRDPQKADRDFVMSFMHHNGAHRSKLSNKDWETFYLACDGFGQISRAFASDQCWDWSHVRDSSPDTLKAIATLLRKQFPGIRYASKSLG